MYEMNANGAYPCLDWTREKSEFSTGAWRTLGSRRSSGMCEWIYWRTRNVGDKTVKRYKGGGEGKRHR